MQEPFRIRCRAAIIEASAMRISLISRGRSRRTDEMLTTAEMLRNNAPFLTDTDAQSAKYLLANSHQIIYVAPPTHREKLENLTNEAKSIIMENSILVYKNFNKTWHQESARLNSVVPINVAELSPKFKFVDQPDNEYETDESGRVIYCQFTGKEHKLPFTHIERYSQERFEFLTKSLGQYFNIIERK